MTKFVYTLINKEGNQKKSNIDAIDREEAARQIREEGWHILSIIPARQAYSLALFRKKYKLSATERMDFTDHLSSMIRTGTPLVEALSIYHDEEENKEAIAFIVEDIIANIRQGKKLSESLETFPETFSPFYVALVQAGEQTGNLDETLGYLANELRREYEFHARIKSALLYPSVVLSVAFAVMILLIFLVIPKITELTKALGGDLPLSTRIVSTVAGFLTSYGALLIVLIIGSVVGLFFALRNYTIRAKIDPYILRLPLFGKLIKKFILARFLRIVGSSLKYGIPISSTFTMVGNVVGNRVYRRACDSIEKNLIKGMNVSQALTREGSDLFPKSVVRTVRGAEKTGTIDIAMLRLSTFYEGEVDRNLKRLTDLIEPALVISLGVIVGAIAIAVIAPIYQLTSKIR
ncbi:hypothetical protein A3G65_01320 [Candidatus Roizmanbacteria bacterium RIFCSPLOWO2_12_FULL_37_7b]|nr:MAG: hypothetical protein A3G65_01320 [Candidatus Roizmanbacteria bacterium RIFCSPLOWO2_12_FULL_37_7b]